MDTQKRRRAVGRYLGQLASQRNGNTHRCGALILKAINCPPHPRPWGPIWIPWVIHPCSMVSMVLAPWAPTGGGMGGGGGMGPGGAWVPWVLGSWDGAGSLGWVLGMGYLPSGIVGMFPCALSGGSWATHGCLVSHGHPLFPMAAALGPRPPSYPLFSSPQC